MSIDQTAGHVFVTRGDLTTLACDDCLVVVQIAPDPTLIVTLAAA